MNVLGIPGSLRSESITSRLLDATLGMLPEHVSVKTFGGSGLLPHFSPDIDNERVAESVLAWREQLDSADAFVICTPEYAFGIPGSFKNALDWAVSSGGFNEKPVVVIAASPLSSGGESAMASLLPTLKALGTVLVDDGALTVPFVKSKIDDSNKIIDVELSSHLAEVLAQLTRVCQSKI